MSGPPATVADTFEPRAKALHEYIFSNPASGLQNNPWAVVDAIERYSNKEGMIVYKGHKLAASRKELETMQPFPNTLLEFGTYVGNSAIAWAAMLREINQYSGDCQCHVYTFELNSEMARIARDFIKLAGVDDIVSVLEGPGGESLKKLHTEGKLVEKMDVVFFDHWQEYYLPDLKLCEDLGVIRPGSKIIADNTDFPGAPKYLAYVKAGGGEKIRYDSRSVETEEPGKANIIEVSTVVSVA